MSVSNKTSDRYLSTLKRFKNERRSGETRLNALSILTIESKHLNFK